MTEPREDNSTILNNLEHNCLDKGSIHEMVNAKELMYCHIVNLSYLNYYICILISDYRQEKEDMNEKRTLYLYSAIIKWLQRLKKMDEGWQIKKRQTDIFRH